MLSPPIGKSGLCGCRPPEIDELGRVLNLQTCPICMRFALANIRGEGLALAYENGVSQLLVQKEFFSFSPYSASDSREVV